MVTATVTTIKTKTAFPLKPLPAMQSVPQQNVYMNGKLITGLTIGAWTPEKIPVKPSPVTLQAIVNPLTKVSLPGTTIPATKTVVPLSLGSIVDVVAQAVVPKKTTTTVNAITPTYTEAQKKAFTTATNVKLGQWYLKTSPTLLPTIAMLKTKSTLSTISKAGYEINVAGTSRALTEATGYINANYADIGAYETLYNKYLTETQAQNKYISELSGTIETLKAGTVQGAINYEQLKATLDKYLAELNKPPETTGMDWKSLILYGALAIGGIIVLWALLRKK